MKITNKSRSKRALLSSVVALTLEIVTTISGLIIPRLILSSFGSEVNGLISSITQFLGYISLLQLGAGGVIRAALYKPLAVHDEKQISKIVKAADVFFGKIAVVSIAYIIVLSFLYPYISKSSFGFLYVSGMVLILGIDSVAQYAWGFPKRQLLYADQRSYTYDFIRIIAITVNVLATVLLIQLGCEIHIVKLASAIVFVLQPLGVNIYTTKHYKLVKHIEPDNGAVRQRWAGVGYSLADFVHKKTDIFVLTIISNLKEVSVYSIYSLVVNGINSIISMATYSFQSVLGDILAKNEKKALNNTMDLYIFLVHCISTIVFSVTLCLVIPFVKLYTHGITDIEYSRPFFAILIVTAEMMYCLRQPFQSIILAAGHFKQTQRGAIIEALINLCLSIILVMRFGIDGVAFGTVIGVLYRTIDLVLYLKRNIIYINIKSVFKRYLITLSQVISIVFVYNALNVQLNSVLMWIVTAVTTMIASIVFVGFVNYVLYRNEFEGAFKKLLLALGIRN